MLLGLGIARFFGGESSSSAKKNVLSESKATAVKSGSRGKRMAFWMWMREGSGFSLLTT